MKKNVGKTDAYIRYGLGVVFLVLAVILQGWYWLLLVPAVLAIATGALGFCGLYSLFGISTCKLEDQK